MDELAENLKSRRKMIRRLHAEIVGPDPSGEPTSLSNGQTFTWEEWRRAKVQVNGEEIVWQDPPTKRYGAGILFPIATAEQTLINANEAAEELPADAIEAQDAAIREGNEERRDISVGELPEDPTEEGLTLANAFKPSAIGLSFLADFNAEEPEFCVEIVCVRRDGDSDFTEMPSGYYKPLTLRIENKKNGSFSDKKVWLRHPILGTDGQLPKVELKSKEVLTSSRVLSLPIGPTDLGLELLLVSRSWKGAPSPLHRLITVSLVNKKLASDTGIDQQSIFQAGIRVRGASGKPWISQYPEVIASEIGDSDPLSDENINRLLYRENRTFAIGHGCAADWELGRPASVASVWSDVLPLFETPATSAELSVREGDKVVALRASMRELAGLGESDDGLASVERLINEYEQWIGSLRRTTASIPPANKPTAEALIKRCEDCLSRILAGLTLLRSRDAKCAPARQAFRLANEAMLVAQWRSRQSLRVPSYETGNRLTWPPAQPIDPAVPHETVGYWRPFQIAFLLMSLPGVVEPTHPDRLTVDLIWFPTGGGKTEAYLGLTAFTVLFNALTKQESAGVDVLMRYTLRLLTAQQFQRAAVLFCAMEVIRERMASQLGPRPFSIGLWVGGSATPNKRQDALMKLRMLQRDPDAENPFVLLRCPWCAAKFGPIPPEQGDTGRRGARRVAGHVLGYTKDRLGAEDTVVYRCSDPACEFGGSAGGKNPPLPIVVIDEDLLVAPPNLLIGTVDKFAMLAWTPGARSIFGIDSHGRHSGAPPTLVIQDELHLISGPLGSMVGAFETVIEALCVDPHGGMVRPKIIASTATISRANQQILGLYARHQVMIFPPAGLDAADSFFAREAKDGQGNPLPGRLYAGVLAPSHGSLQTTEARVFATLLQSAPLVSDEALLVDPWWTLLVFFNSLRELGGAATLFTADTREYLRVILDRLGIDYSRIRALHHVEELTSRIRSDHIPKLLEELEVRYLGQATGAQRPAIDACLASSIIEVGVDIPRLALMAIVGQPKTTSQYIQVSSRVGRDSKRPGLVVVLYGQTKPRDRSHYERFRSYHQRLYAQVEPTSVTPFSPPAVDRALHSVIVSLVRQLGELSAEARSPDPFPLTAGSQLFTRIEEVISDRVRQIAPAEESAVMERFRQRLRQWKQWQPSEYGGFGTSPEDPPLMHPAGSSEPAQWGQRSWATMSSLRNVDASCEADVTTAYMLAPGDAT